MTQRDDIKFLDDQIATAKKRLADIEVQVARLQREAMGWRSVAEGHAMLKEAALWRSAAQTTIDLGDAGQPSHSVPIHLGGPQVQPDLVLPDGSVVQTKTPRGEAAVLAVLDEFDEIEGRKLKSIIVDRQWIDPDAKDPGGAVNAALHRLVRKGKVHRVGFGVYSARDFPSTDGATSASEEEVVSS